MRHWWRQSIREHRAVVSNTQIKRQASLRGHLFVSVSTRIHNYALLRGDNRRDGVIEWVAQHHVRFRSRRHQWPLSPQLADSFRKLCDAIIFNYPAVLQPHNDPDELQPRPPSQTMWRLRQSEGVYHLVREPVVGAQETLGVVHTVAMAQVLARHHDPAVLRFDPHHWLDGFTPLWSHDGRHGSTSHPRLSPTQTRGAAEVADRARQASAASPRIGKALASVSWKQVARLAASSSSQRLLLHKIKGLRLSGWDRVHNRRGCPHCPLRPTGIDTGHTHHTVWHCRAAQALWAIFRGGWCSLGLTPATSDPEWCTAIFSLHLPQTPPMVWSVLGAGTIPHVLVARVYELLSTLWQQQALSCLLTIWRWRNGVGDADLPWTQAMAKAALRASLRAAYHQVLGTVRHSDPHEWALRGLLVTMQRLQLTPTAPVIACPSHSTDQFLLFFDGGSRGNPGPGGASAVIVRVDAFGNQSAIVWASAISLANTATTNNQAEYVGLITGLRRAVAKRLRPLTIIGDSLMIINQLSRHRPPKSETLGMFYGRAQILADTLGVTQWRHHVRAFNKMADCAANLSAQTPLPCTRPFWAELATHLHEDVAKWQVSRTRLASARPPIAITVHTL